jgi:SAM-dependent methyltransferase
MEREQGSRTKDKEANEDCVHDGHLGGCAMNGDGAGYCPRTWSHLIKKYNIKSMVDVGCGAGFSADYFKDLGVEVLGVEGCKEAVERSLLPKENVVLHDYENDGPYVPDRDFDFCWSNEFVEHVEGDCAQNFLATFKKCRMIAMTFAGPGQGGHHHVNEQPIDYWLDRLSEIGFTYDEKETKECKEFAKLDMIKYCPYGGNHFVARGLLFHRNGDPLPKNESYSYAMPDVPPLKPHWDNWVLYKKGGRFEND